jgi:hypothetical protein
MVQDWEMVTSIGGTLGMKAEKSIHLKGAIGLSPGLLNNFHTGASSVVTNVP